MRPITHKSIADEPKSGGKKPSDSEKQAMVRELVKKALAQKDRWAGLKALSDEDLAETRQGSRPTGPWPQLKEAAHKQALTELGLRFAVEQHDGRQ